MPINKRIVIGLIFAIFASGIFFRVYHISKYDLWFDELQSEMYSAQKIANVVKLGYIPTYINRISSDAHSPLYYLSVYAYSSVFGEGKSLRVISLIFSLLSLVVFYKLSRLILKQSESLAALALMAFSPFQIWYAQEARAYTMALFFAVLSAYLYIRALRINRISDWVLFTISAILAICSNYNSVLLIILLSLLVFLKDNRHCLKKWYLASFAVMLLFLPLVLLYIQHFNAVKNISWIARPAIRDIFIIFAVFNLGYSSGYIELIAGSILFFALFVYGTYSFYKTNKAYAVVLSSIVLIPVLAAYFLSIWYVPIYLPRQFLLLTPFYYLLIARGWGSIGDKRLRITASACVILLLAFTLRNYYNGFILSPENEKALYGGIHPKKNYSGLLSELNAKRRDNDIVVTADIQSLGIFNIYFYDGLDPRFCRFIFYPFALTSLDKHYLRIAGLVDAVPEQDRTSLYTMEYIPRYPIQDRDVLFKRFNNRLIKKFPLDQIMSRRIWLISSTWGSQGYLSYNSSLVRKALSGCLERQSSAANGGMLVELYAGEKGLNK